jgi:hypothetical protein
MMTTDLSSFSQMPLPRIVFNTSKSGNLACPASCQGEALAKTEALATTEIFSLTLQPSAHGLPACFYNCLLIIDN